MKKLVREGLDDILKGKSKEEFVPEGGDIVKFYRSPDPEEDHNATSLIGTLHTSYKRLVELFGKPQFDFSEDGYKVAFTWVVRDEKGNAATIYDWKATNLYDGDGPSPQQVKKMPNFDWHIGGSGGGNYTPGWISQMMGGEAAVENETVRNLKIFIYFNES